MNVETSQQARLPLVGRPPKHDYQALKPELERLINEERYGIMKLSKRYGLSYKWMRHILEQLGLRTLGQPHKEGA